MLAAAIIPISEKLQKFSREIQMLGSILCQKKPWRARTIYKVRGGWLIVGIWASDSGPELDSKQKTKHPLDHKGNLPTAKTDLGNL